MSFTPDIESIREKRINKYKEVLPKIIESRALQMQEYGVIGLDLKELSELTSLPTSGEKEFKKEWEDVADWLKRTTSFTTEITYYSHFGRYYTNGVIIKDTLFKRDDKCNIS